MKKIVVLFILTACSSTPEINHEKLATIAFETPSEWRRHEIMRVGGQAAEWRPTNNKRRESINVVRNELSPHVAAANPSYLASLVAQAHTSLADARILSTTTIATKHGLTGVRVTLDFVPAGMKERYRRVHVLLVEDRALVNVIYTARQPDSRALDVVLESIRHEEG
jgi:hypothetical protein